MIRRPPRSTLDRSSAASDVYKRQVIADTLTTLNALDIGRGDRVAIVLNNGPEMAACYMACASGVTSAPLNPAYRADEFEFYLQDLNAKALIVEAGSASPAVGGAQKPVSYTQLRAPETVLDLVCRLLPEKKKTQQYHHTHHPSQTTNNTSIIN